MSAAQIPEPIGLGAVVEDTDGSRWVRSADARWYCEDWDDSESWVDIHVIRVLSEGVAWGVTDE